MSRVTIRTGCQTGVDLGAFWAGVNAKIPVVGYVPYNRRNEVGLLPRAVLSHPGIKVCPRQGYAARTLANLREATALLLIVDGEIQSPGTRMTWENARHIVRKEKLGVPVQAAQHAAAAVKRWLTEVESIDLMIAGPRRSQWNQGTYIARRVVEEIARVIK